MTVKYHGLLLPRFILACQVRSGISTTSSRQLHWDQLFQMPSKHLSESLERGAKDLENSYKKVMSNVPQPVVVVTTAKYNQARNAWLKRGVTCSSFTSVSLQPPIISFSMARPSRMHDLLMETQKFAVHVMSKDQVGYGVHFAKPAKDNADQFTQIPHTLSDEGLPVINDTAATLICRYHSVTTIGDHYMWYGQVEETTKNEGRAPMIYYKRSFRSVGDEAFMQAFEDQTLPFEDWTHEAHIRMAWNYIRDFGKEEAIPLIRKGIQHYNEQNKEKISRGYNETVTQFYIHMISECIVTTSDPDITFEEFLEANRDLVDPNLLWNFYTLDTVSSPEAQQRFLLPDRRTLPGH